MRPTPFGTDWDALDADTLAAFFETADDETLLWEAKGDEVRPEHIRRAASAFGNSPLGGYLVLGVRRDADGPWRLDGWEPRTEPTLWVSSVLSDGGVTPAPPFDVKAWSVEDGRHLAVVWIGPAAVPPVLTRDGQAYERLPGQTVRIADSTTLRRLFERGEVASERAVQVSVAGRDDLAMAPPGGRSAVVVISLASPALPPDASGIVFRDSTYRAMVEVVNRLLAAVPVRLRESGADLSQHALTVWSTGFAPEEGYSVRVGRHGAVALGVHEPDTVSGLKMAAERSPQFVGAWDAAIAVMARLIPGGPVHVALRVHNPGRGSVDMTRWAEAGGPSADSLESVAREARRAQGERAWEP